MKKQRLAKRLPTAKVFTYEGVKFWIAPWCEPMYFDKTMDVWTQVRCASDEHNILERRGW